MLKNANVMRRMALSFGAMLALVVLAGAGAWFTAGKLGGLLETGVVHTGRVIGSIGQLNAALADMRAAQQGLILYYSISDAAQVETNKQRFQAASTRASAAVQALRDSDAAQNAAVSTLEAGLGEWSGFYREMTNLCGQQKCSEGLNVAAQKIAPLAERMSRSASELEQAGRDLLASGERESARQVARVRWITGLLLAVAFLVSAGVMIGIRGLHETLTGVATDISSGSESVAAASHQVSQASQALAQGASEQAASLQQTSASAKEVGSMTHKNAENARAAAELMQQATAIVATVEQAIREMAKSMAEINASSDSISKIIKVIDEIAFQTNILALNAAVEAARAGEAGMGFAVVADEVRNLAQRSAQAAKDTAALIDESIRKANEGRGKLDQVTRAMSSNVETANKAKRLVDEVDVGSQEQARAIQQISTAIEQMEQVTQRTAAHAEQSASAGEEMGAQAKSMNAAVARLRALMGAGPAAYHNTPSRPRSGAVESRRSLGAQAPAGAHAAEGREAFPLDGDFKEF